MVAVLAKFHNIPFYVAAPYIPDSPKMVPDFEAAHENAQRHRQPCTGIVPHHPS